MGIVESIPIVTFEDPEESDEVTVMIELEPPTDDDLLELYERYLEGGGEPYEPLASMRSERIRGRLGSPSPEVA